MSASNITVNEHAVNFTVDTVHEQMLEFFLSDTEKRLNKDPGFYSTQLDRMIAAVLAPFETATLSEMQMYGYYTLTICADTREELDKALAACDAVIPKWKAKYNVSKMTRSQ
jgi:hypothetical protein